MYRNIPHMLDTVCRRHRFRKAVLGRCRTIRYYKLRREADRLASILINKYKIMPQEKAAVLLDNSPEYITAYFSILKAGAVVVPLNTFLKGPELEYILKDSGAVLLITAGRFCPVFGPIRHRLDRLRDVVLMGEKADSYGRLEEREILPGDTAVIIYTSGTTGRPKGAMLSHRNILANVESSVEASLIGKKDRVLLVLPMFHSFTMTVCMLMPIAAGAGIVLGHPINRFGKLFRQIPFSGVSIISAIPSFYALLAKAKPPWWARPFLRLRLCISGAAPLPENVLAAFEAGWKVPLLEGYGLSEASPVVSLNPVKGKKKRGSAGIPVSGVEVKVVGDDEAELPRGSVGEIIVKGGNVMKGYYNNPSATSDALRGGWLFTGDMGKIDEEGYIYIVDRKKDMILVRGLNVYPREVEDVLYQYPGISCAAVTARSDPNKGEVPVAFITKKDNTLLNPSNIIKFCRERLADYKVPRQIIIKDSLPMTPTGKILKRMLKG